MLWHPCACYTWGDPCYTGLWPQIRNYWWIQCQKRMCQCGLPWNPRHICEFTPLSTCSNKLVVSKLTGPWMEPCGLNPFSFTFFPSHKSYHSFVCSWYLQQLYYLHGEKKLESSTHWWSEVHMHSSEWPTHRELTRISENAADMALWRKVREEDLKGKIQVLL